MLTFGCAGFFPGLAVAQVKPTTAPPIPATPKLTLKAPTTASLEAAATQATPVDEFDPAQYPTGDFFGYRRQLADRGITIDSNLIVDGSKNFMGGLDTGELSFRERFNFGLEFDAEKLFGLHGGTFAAVYQLQHGGHAAHEITGDAQNFSFGTDADGRSQLGQLWYQQKLADDTLRLKLGKMDANADFDVLDNGVEFLNNSFSTSPTLGLMPSFPDNGMGVQLFWEPKCGFYGGAGIFDGSIARGVRIGEYGPAHFLDRADNLFLIAEIGQRYDLSKTKEKLPGKISLGGWWDTNPFPTLDGGAQDGTGGVYFTLDQVLWKPAQGGGALSGPNPQDVTEAQTTEFTHSLAATFSLSYADSQVNSIDGNALAGLTYTGLIPSRPIDVLGGGATLAHFSDQADTRDSFELAIEAFYRVRFTEWISLKPDLQYIIHPSGAGNAGSPLLSDALVFTMRLEMTF